MALNDPGLQSLSSIAASEFYDVTITDTNSPIEQGDTLVVDYEVSNTGDKTGAQDITLEIEDVLEDTDSGVRVLANRTDSGTLEWVTESDETAQDYTATVLSADDSPSQTVTVEDAEAEIPDSEVYLHDDWGDSQLQTRDGSGTVTYNGVEGVYRPEWTLDLTGSDSATPNADNETLLFEGADNRGQDALRANINLPLNEGKVIWEFKNIDTSQSRSGGAARQALFCFAESTSITDWTYDNGYFVDIAEGSVMAFSKVDNTNAQEIIIDGGTPPTSPYDVTVTRETDGTWELFINGVSQGTTVDTTYTTPEIVGYIGKENDDTITFEDEMKVGATGITSEAWVYSAQTDRVNRISQDSTHVYPNSYDGSIAKIDKSDGSEIWRNVLFTGKANGSTVDDTHVYVGNREDSPIQLKKLDKSDGSEITDNGWPAEHWTDDIRGVTDVGNDLYVASTEGNIKRVDKETGALEETLSSPFDGGTRQIVTDGDFLYVGETSNNFGYKITTTPMSEEWRADFGDGVFGVGIDDDHVYFAGNPSTVGKFDKSDGSEVWKQDTGATGRAYGIASDGSNVFVGRDSGDGLGMRNAHAGSLVANKTSQFVWNVAVDAGRKLVFEGGDGNELRAWNYE